MLAATANNQWVTNTLYRLKFRVETNGSTTDLKVKFWAASGSEPSGWTLTCNDANLALQGVSGRMGIIGTTCVSTGRYWRFDDYQGSILGAGGGAGGGTYAGGAAATQPPAFRQVQASPSAQQAADQPVDAAAGISLDILSPLAAGPSASADAPAAFTTLIGDRDGPAGQANALVDPSAPPVEAVPFTWWRGSIVA